MRYAHIDEDNKIIGWYDSEIHKEIPTPNVEANNDVWQNAINNNHNKINNDGTTELFDFRTDEEIAQSLIDDKWTEYSVFENSLTIDIVVDENTTHTYNASPSSLLTIERKAVSAYTTEVREILMGRR